MYDNCFGWYADCAAIDEKIQQSCWLRKSCYEYFINHDGIVGGLYDRVKEEINMEINMKGQQCPYSKIPICQESYCGRCEIFETYQKQKSFANAFARKLL